MGNGDLLNYSRFNKLVKILVILGSYFLPAWDSKASRASSLVSLWLSAVWLVRSTNASTTATILDSSGISSPLSPLGYPLPSQCSFESSIIGPIYLRTLADSKILAVAVGQFLINSSS